MNCEILALSCFSLSGATPTIPYALPPLTQNELCKPPHLCILVLPWPEKPHTWKLWKLKCPTYLWSWGCHREVVTRVQPEYLSQSIKLPPTQEQTTSDLQAGSLNPWLPLPTMGRHKCFTWKSRWELDFSSRSAATVLEEVLTPPSFLPGVLQNTCNFMRLRFYQASLQWWQGAFILPEMQREVRNHRDTNLMANLMAQMLSYWWRGWTPHSDLADQAGGSSILQVLVGAWGKEGQPEPGQALSAHCTIPWLTYNETKTIQQPYLSVTSIKLWKLTALCHQWLQRRSNTPAK